MNRQTLFFNLLNLNRTSKDIMSSALISKDGLVVASGLPYSFDEIYIAALTAGLFSMAVKTSQIIIGGELRQIILKSEKNNVLMMRVGEFGLLIVITEPQALIELILFKMKHSSDKFKGVLNELYSPESYHKHYGVKVIHDHCQYAIAC